jgi:hypothetical protein
MTTKPVEHPILFSGPMVLKILANQKTQTRRVVVPRQSTPKVAPLKMEPWFIGDERQTYDDGRPLWVGFHPAYEVGGAEAKWFACDYGQPGDRLWVRESLHERDGTWFYDADGAPVLVAESDRLAMITWAHHKQQSYCPSIHMPRWTSRILLDLKDVDVQQVQSISDADILAEGFPLDPPSSMMETDSAVSGIGARTMVRVGVRIGARTGTGNP